MLLSQDPNGCLEMLHVLYFNLQITNSSVTGLLCITVSNLYIFRSRTIFDRNLLDPVFCPCQF